MFSRHELRLDWCSYQAATFAVERWHYSAVMPRGKNVYLGVWEAGAFIGAVIFGTGSGNATHGDRFGLGFMQMAELVRVALAPHRAPVTRILAVAVRLLKAQSPGLRLLVSFADPNQGHHGGIYQAANWTYHGLSAPGYSWQLPDGRVMHSRAFSPGKWIRQHKPPVGSKKVRLDGKHRYLFPLDDEIRAVIAPLALPYPKRAGSSDSGTAPDQGAGDGAIPIPALSTIAYKESLNG